MTVAELIKKLKKLPEDSKVVILNDSDYEEGAYIAINAYYDKKDNTTTIISDYSDWIGEL